MVYERLKSGEERRGEEGASEEARHEYYRAYKGESERRGEGGYSHYCHEESWGISFFNLGGRGVDKGGKRNNMVDSEEIGSIAHGRKRTSLELEH